MSGGQLSGGQLSGVNCRGSIVGGSIVGGSIVGGSIAGGSIVGGQLSGGQLSGCQLSGGQPINLKISVHDNLANGNKIFISNYCAIKNYFFDSIILALQQPVCFSQASYIISLYLNMHSNA